MSILKNSKISINDLLRTLKETSKTYRKISLEQFDDAKINRHVGYLNKILSTPTYIFLMHFFTEGSTCQHSSGSIEDN